MHWSRSPTVARELSSTAAAGAVSAAGPTSAVANDGMKVFGLYKAGIAASTLPLPASVGW